MKRRAEGGACRRRALVRAMATCLLLVASARADELHVLSPPFQPNGGHAYTVALPAEWTSDGPDGLSSRLQVFEDGRALGPAHATHDDIRRHGAGRYSHWNGTLYLSASDNSDPGANGRTYSVSVPRLPPGREGYLSVPPRDPFALLDDGALARAVVGGALPAPAAERGRRPRLIHWYTIDALRADTAFLDVDGAPLMPALRAFAAEAVRFERAYAHSSFTKVSTASMFTGLVPTRHGVMHGVVPVWPAGGALVFDLDLRFYTLAEFLRDAGYTTATHPFTVHVRPGDGMLQGFARLDLEDGLRAPDGSAHEPRFVYEHVLGVHGPYDPSAAARRATGWEPSGIIDPAATDWFDRVLDAQELAELRRAYEAEAVDADARWARRVEDLRARGLWDDAVIIVTSDHGEAFGEHGATQHASTLSEEVVRVPLLVRFPAGHPWAARHGETLAQRVRLVDLYATLVDLLGYDESVLPYALDGRSLGPILTGDETDPVERDVLLRTTVGARVDDAGDAALLTSDAVLHGDLKALLGWRMAASQVPTRKAFAPGDWFAELYDVTRDPRERHDLLDARPGDFERLRARWRGSFRPLVAGSATAADEGVPADEGGDAMDEDLLQRLRALGYLR